MKVYLVIIEDRHNDVQVEVYATEEDAVYRACELIDEYDYTPEEPDVEIPGSFFNASLSGEGDCVHVKEAEVR